MRGFLKASTPPSSVKWTAYEHRGLFRLVGVLFRRPERRQVLAAAGDMAHLIVPVVTIYEVFKVVLRERNENDALAAVAVMQKGHVVDCTAALAVSAASLSLKHRLPMADSLILARRRHTPRPFGPKTPTSVPFRA